MIEPPLGDKWEDSHNGTCFRVTEPTDPAAPCGSGLATARSPRVRPLSPGRGA